MPWICTSQDNRYQKLLSLDYVLEMIYSVIFGTSFLKRAKGWSIEPPSAHMLSTQPSDQKYHYTHRQTREKTHTIIQKPEPNKSLLHPVTTDKKCSKHE